MKFGSESFHNKKRESWDKIEDNLVHLEWNFYGHPCGGLLWESQNFLSQASAVCFHSEMEQVPEEPLREAPRPYMSVLEIRQKPLTAQKQRRQVRTTPRAGFLMKHEPADGQALVGSPFGLCVHMRTVESRGTEFQGGRRRPLCFRSTEL